LQRGFIARTPRGRVLTPQAFTHLGLPQPAQPAQFPLFNGGEDS
jgi:Holliday junction DNA helicase RuvB